MRNRDQTGFLLEINEHRHIVYFLKSHGTEQNSHYPLNVENNFMS